MGSWDLQGGPGVGKSLTGSGFQPQPVFVSSGFPPDIEKAQTCIQTMFPEWLYNIHYRDDQMYIMKTCVYLLFKAIQYLLVLKNPIKGPLFKHLGSHELDLLLKVRMLLNKIYSQPYCYSFFLLPLIQRSINMLLKFL